MRNFFFPSFLPRLQNVVTRDIRAHRSLFFFFFFRWIQFLLRSTSVQSNTFDVNHHNRITYGSGPDPGPFCAELACSPTVHMGSLHVLSVLQRSNDLPIRLTGKSRSSVGFECKFKRLCLSVHNCNKLEYSNFAQVLRQRRAGLENRWWIDGKQHIGLQTNRTLVTSLPTRVCKSLLVTLQVCLV